MIINSEIWDSANVTLNGKKAEGKSDINGNFIIKDLNSNSECLELIATKDKKEPFKANVKRDFTEGVIECENIPIVTTYYSVGSSSTTIVTQPTPIQPKNILESISITPTTLKLKIGESVNINIDVIGRYTDNTEKNETNNTTFKILNESIASINSGIISAKSAGNTELIATVRELNSSLSIEVTKVLESIFVSIEPATLTLVKGETSNLKVLGKFTDGTETDLTSTATFTSSNEDNISIDNSGLVTALNEGSSTIEIKVENFIERVNLSVITEDTTIESKNMAESYSDLIASNATVEKFDEKRFCIVRGAIKGIDNKALSNVEVSIKEYPEYGSVKSDINGEFAIAIEGGGVVTIRYQKDGYTIVDRQVDFVVMNTPEGNQKQYIITQHEDGSFENSTIVFSGEKSSTITSSDDSNITSLACEVSRVSKFDYDDELKKSYLSKVITTLPSGLTKTVEMNRSYEGKDFNYSSITKGYSVNSKTTTTTHDIDNSKYITTSPEGRILTSYYDSESLLPIRDEVAGILSTEYSYDSKGRVIATKVGDRNSSYIYSDRGNVESFTNSKGLTTNYQYDLLDRVIKVVKPNSSELHFSYDKMGAMTMFRVPTSAEHNFSYNSLGKNTSYTTPQSRVTTYRYDKDRRIIETILASKNSILYSYSSGRLSSILTPDWQIDYVYACMNSVASITKGSEVINYSYDGELITKITQSGSLNQMIEFTYSSDFDIDSITYSGATNSYSYDLDGLLIASSGFTISRNALNGLAESVEDGTFKLDRVFNGYSEVDSETFSIASTPLYSYEVLNRDSSGRVTSKRETIDSNSTEWSYSYDDVGRLVEVSKNSEVVEVYEYDSNGNRVLSTSKERDINATASYYLDDTVETFGNVGYIFDEDGYLKLKNSIDGNVTYSYSRTGELLKVIKEDNTTIEYTHDPLGRRVAKSIDGVVVEKYLWLDRTTLLAVYDGNDNLTQRFNYADSRVPFSMEKDGGLYYLFYDQVGTLRVVSDSSGNVVKEVDYDSFGNILSDSDENLTIPFGFAGGLHDRDINLIRFGFRDYDPYIGKWTARDPILFEGGDSNLYGYVLNDPINFIDPEGLAGFNSPGKTTLDAGMVGGASGRCGLGGGGTRPYAPNRSLPRTSGGEPKPDSLNPHTQLGLKNGRNGTYPQAREFDKNGKPVKDIDFTDHGRPNVHPNPHQHKYINNATGGTLQRSKTAEPLSW